MTSLTSTPAAPSRFYVYAVGPANTDKPTKIGRASDLSSRVASLQTGSPVALELKYAVVVGSNEIAIATEELAHSVLSAHRLHGEWFDITAPHVARAINEARNAAVRDKRDRQIAAELSERLVAAERATSSPVSGFGIAIGTFQGKPAVAAITDQSPVLRPIGTGRSNGRRFIIASESEAGILRPIDVFCADRRTVTFVTEAINEKIDRDGIA